MDEKLVYIGKIAELETIENADFIVSATVICGPGGKWKGIVRKSDFQIGDKCIVFLPDSLLDPEIHYYMPFMEKTNWRVKMVRFKGSPSEVVIIKIDNFPLDQSESQVGSDVTVRFGVKKYIKEVPANLQGKAKGYFPNFIPKTDEPNFQREPELVESLIGLPFYITEKCDGSSTTAFKWKGELRVCSRNLELIRDEENGYWQVCKKYDLQDKLPEGIAIQFETCGPKIQSNPMGLKEIDGFMFSAYNIKEHKYLEYKEMLQLYEEINFPMAPLLSSGTNFSVEDIELYRSGNYENGKPREGIVVRSKANFNGKPISFKAINLDYGN